MTKKVTAILLALFALTALCACTSENAAMTYKDQAITRSEYSYWFSTLKSQVYSKFLSDEKFAGMPEADRWNTEFADGVTYADHFTEIVNEQIATVAVAKSLFDEYGLSLDDSVYESIDSDIAEKVEYSNGEDNVNDELSYYGLDLDALRDVYVTKAKISLVREKIGELEDGDLSAYFAENYRAVKLIAIYTGVDFVRDPDGNIMYDEEGKARTFTLDEQTKGQKIKLVDAVLEALRSGADVDECIDEFSEADYSDSPRGFFISKNDADSFGEQVVDAAFSLEIGEAAAVSDSEITFIVCRVELPDYSDLTKDEMVKTASIVEYAENEKVNKVFEPLVKDVITDTSITDDFDIRTAHRNSYY